MDITVAIYAIAVGWWVLVIGLILLLAWCVRLFAVAGSEDDAEQYPCPHEYEPRCCEASAPICDRVVFDES